MAADDRTDIERLAKLFDLPSWDKIEELNLDYSGGVYVAVRKEAIEDGKSEDEAEKVAQDAELKASGEVYRDWHDAVEAVADEIFGAHHLELVPVKKGERTPFEYRIKPVEGKTWTDAAYAIRETIHGVGIFDIPVERGRFEDETPREWVLTRKHHMAYYPEVYGTPSANRIYERSWR